MRQSDMNDTWLRHRGRAVGYYWPSEDRSKDYRLDYRFGKWWKVKPQIREEFCNPRLVSVLVLRLGKWGSDRLKYLAGFERGWDGNWLDIPTTPQPFPGKISCSVGWAGAREAEGRWVETTDVSFTYDQQIAATHNVTHKQNRVSYFLKGFSYPNEDTG